MTAAAARLLLVLLSAMPGLVPGLAVAGDAGTVSPERLAELRRAPDRSLLVIDLRSLEDFMAGSIAGALHAEAEPGDYAPAEDIRTIVLIPRAADDTAVIDTWVARLDSLGLRVLLLEGGPDAWRAAGLPMQMPGPPVYADPGAVPFVVPRGICEHLPPVQEY